MQRYKAKVVKQKITVKIYCRVRKSTRIKLQLFGFQKCLRNPEMHTEIHGFLLHSLHIKERVVFHAIMT